MLTFWRAGSGEKEKEKEKNGVVKKMENGGECALPLGVSITSSTSHFDPTPSPKFGNLKITPNSPSPPFCPPPPSPNKNSNGRSASPKSKPAVLKIYIYHGNARRPDPAFLADFDVVITTYATLASEYGRQLKSIASSEDTTTDGNSEEDDQEIMEGGNGVIRLVGGGRAKARSAGSGSTTMTVQKEVCGQKRKKPCSSSCNVWSVGGTNGKEEATSPLQMVHWFRVVLDEAQ
jgi:SNF2 family DNA or RNA helicase